MLDRNKESRKPRNKVCEVGVEIELPKRVENFPKILSSDWSFLSNLCSSWMKIALRAKGRVGHTPGPMGQ